MAIFISTTEIKDHLREKGVECVIARLVERLEFDFKTNAYLRSGTFFI
jgi:hypothetical protein